MFVVLGADWCHGCKGVRKKLTALGLEHKYVRMPTGEKGWDLVEKMTGRRAVPAVFYKFETLKEFYKAMDDLKLEERQLTEDELEEIND
jgi:glutaredoxin